MKYGNEINFFFSPPFSFPLFDEMEGSDAELLVNMYFIQFLFYLFCCLWTSIGMMSSVLILHSSVSVLMEKCLFLSSRPECQPVFNAKPLPWLDKPLYLLQLCF